MCFLTDIPLRLSIILIDQFFNRIVAVFLLSIIDFEDLKKNLFTVLKEMEEHRYLLLPP